MEPATVTAAPACGSSANLLATRSSRPVFKSTIRRMAWPCRKYTSPVRASTHTDVSHVLGESSSPFSRTSVRTTASLLATRRIRAFSTPTGGDDADGVEIGNHQIAVRQQRHGLQLWKH